MNITRRSALMVAAAAVVVAGVPAATSAATLGNPDAKLFALIDGLERVDREHTEVAMAEAMERKAIEDRLPMPPAIIRLGEGKTLSRDHMRSWLTVPPGLLEMTRGQMMRSHPERREQIAAHFDRVFAELHAYEAEVDRLKNSPKARALRARLDEIAPRFDELAAEISATAASDPTLVAPAMIASAMRDLGRLARGARS